MIVEELKEVRKSFGDERRTQIVEDPGEILLEDLVQEEDVAITVTRGGYLKRTAVDTYRRQSRGGKGRIGMSTRSEDVVEHLLIGSTHAYVMTFTSKGRVYWTKAYTIPDAGTASKGKNINGLVNLQADETPKAFLMTKDFPEGVFVVMITRNGVIKKCALSEFDNPRNVGIIALSVDEGDELISAQLSTGAQEVFIATREGMAIRFHEDGVRPMGRAARGVRGISLSAHDHVVSTLIVDTEDLVLSISELGYGKRTPVGSYRLQTRGGKGVINMKTTRKTGSVVAVLRVKDTTDLMIITKEGKIIRIESDNIRQAGRSTQGVRLVRMEEGDAVAASSLVPDAGGESENGNGQGDLDLQ